MDLWGQIYLDHWHDDAHPHEFLRDDGKSARIADASAYFAAPNDSAACTALATLTGRVLDLGCGAGSHTRFLEDRGVTVTAINASPGAVTVCRERGCRNVRVADMDALPQDLGRFNNIICLGNTLGIGMDTDALHRRLTALRSLIVPAGRLLAAIRDPLSTTDPDHLPYHARNRAIGRPVGLVRSRLSYRGEVGPWWDLWTHRIRVARGRRGGWLACPVPNAGCGHEALRAQSR